MKIGIKLEPKRQYEYECICGYIWIDSETLPCPMCRQWPISQIPYESLPPENFAHGTTKNKKENK